MPVDAQTLERRFVAALRLRAARGRADRAARARVRGQRVGLPQGLHRHRLGVVGRQVRRRIRASARRDHRLEVRHCHGERHRGAAHRVEAGRRAARRRGAGAGPVLRRDRERRGALWRDSALRRQRADDARTRSRGRLREHLASIAERAGGALRNRASGRRLAAVVPMHTFGHPVRSGSARWKSAAIIALPLVEDAAESLGSYFAGRHTGTLRAAGRAELQRQQDRHDGRRRRDPDAGRESSPGTPGISRPRPSARIGGSSSTTRSPGITGCRTSTPRSAAPSSSASTICWRASGGWRYAIATPSPRSRNCASWTSPRLPQQLLAQRGAAAQSLDGRCATACWPPPTMPAT